MKQGLWNLLALQMACWSVGAGDGNTTSGISQTATTLMDPGTIAYDSPAINYRTLRPSSDVVSILRAHSPIDRSDVSMIIALGSSSPQSHSWKHANGGSMMSEPLLVGERSDTEPHHGDDASTRFIRHRKDREIPSSRKPKRRYMCVRPKNNRRLANPTASGRPHAGSGKKH